jgi:hypothetical protein
VGALNQRHRHRPPALPRARGIGSHSIPPGQPWKNCHDEPFKGRIRDEYLNIDSFWSLARARVVIGGWRATTTTDGGTVRSATYRPGGLPCFPHRPMEINSHTWISSRGPATSRKPVR